MGTSVPTPQLMKGFIMELKKAIEKIVFENYDKEEKEYNNINKFVNIYNSGADHTRNHMFHAMYRLKIALERNEFDNHMKP